MLIYPERTDIVWLSGFLLVKRETGLKTVPAHLTKHFTNSNNFPNPNVDMM